MYYITNQNNHIIAVDSNLLALLEVKNIDELYKNIALGDIKFSSSEQYDEVIITTTQDEKTYDVENINLSGLLGEMTLVQVQTSPAESMLIDDEKELVENILNLDVSEDEELLLPEDDLISIKDTDDLLEDDISLLDDSEKEDSDDALFDLILPDEHEETIETITATETEQAELADESQTPIIVDVENISQSIGISTEDYNTFLNEYIDTALSLEKDLQSTQEEKRTGAVNILTHLSDVLHLPVINKSIIQIKDATADNQNRYIEAFYTTLGRLTTSQLDTTVTEETPFISEPDSEAKHEAIDHLHKEEALSTGEAKSVTPAMEGFGTINLDDVKPIHFDFQLTQAASDLSLPVELIEEFVHDFIEQAHTETDKMLAAYEKGDLDTIQKIGHLLKGTSSNLRINPLADTLYEIQFCEDSSKLEDMIKHYWGHFLSLETQINITRK